MISDRVDVQWQRRRGLRKVHVVAILGSLLAVGGVLSLFNVLGRELGHHRKPPESELIASIDLRIGSPALEATRGDAAARRDIEAGLLKLQTVGPVEPKTRAQAAREDALKRRYGIVWVSKSLEVTPQATAFAEAYNRVMKAEIEHRHGKQALDQLARAEAP